VGNDDERELLWLRRLRDLSAGLAAEVEAQRLFPRILDAAIELTDGERGFLVRVSERGADGKATFRVEAARGFKKGTLDNPRGHVSRTVVKRVLNRGDRGLVTTSEEDRDVVDATSVQQRNVLSILCVPLRLRGVALGVLYVDRPEAGAFSERDLPILESLADQAALAVDRAERPSPVVAPAAPVAEVEEEQQAPQRFGALLGTSQPMLKLFGRIERVAQSDAAVLIQGESGTGKELVARELHARGANPDAPFVPVNCGAIPEGLMERELFGHVKGAYTGAEAAGRGLFLEAAHGTLFLDEVGDLPLPLQAKLLRVLQERRVRPLGGLKLLPVTCRIVAATHRDLEQLVAEGAFRQDLFYRLDVLRLHVPPLRARGDDVLLLAEAIAKAVDPGAALRPDARATLKLRSYSWPGNVRQLENEVRRLLAAGHGAFGEEALSAELREAGPRTEFKGRTLGEVEKSMLVEALREARGNKSQAARELGIPRSTFYDLLDRYDLR